MSPRTAERPGTDGVAVDPRIAARRRSVASEQKRRRRRRLVTVVAVLVVVGGAWFVTRTALLDVDSITVTGAVHESADEVVEASGIRVGDQLLDIGESAAASRVEAMPWVQDVSVSRGLDGVVTIEVVERTPVATVTDAAGTTLLVDVEGRILAPVGADADTSGLVPLEGLQTVEPGATLDGAAGALQAYTALGPGVRSRIAAVVVAPDGTLEMRLVPEGVVVYGPADDVEGKATALATTMGQVDQRGIVRIDVRDPGEPVVVRNQG